MKAQAKKARRLPETVDVTEYTVLLKFAAMGPGQMPSTMAIAINDEQVEMMPLAGGLTVKLLIGRKIPKGQEKQQPQRRIESYAQK